MILCELGCFICEDDFGKIDIVFFNSRENYIRAVLPINKWVLISGKINVYKNKYQITNPEYITSLDKLDYIKKKIPKYSLTDGLNEKTFRKIIENVINSLPELDEWYGPEIIKKFGFSSWKKSIQMVHSVKNNKNHSSYLKRLALDEILSNLLSSKGTFF